MRSISSGSPTPRTASGPVRTLEDGRAAKAFEASLQNAGRAQTWAGQAGRAGPGLASANALPVHSEIDALKAQLGPGAARSEPAPACTACGPLPLPAAPEPLPGPVTRIETPPAAAAIWLGTLSDV